MSTPRPMILPSHDMASGEVQHPSSYRTDARIPGTLWRHGHQWASRAKVVDHFHRTEQCPNGRHLFDVIDTAIDVEEDPVTGDLLDELYQKFEAVLTCVRCGHIVQWKGTRSQAWPTAVQPAPIAAGGLLAQHVYASQSYGRDMSTWSVYRDGDQVGVITWAVGPRGRAYFQGRLEAMPDGQTVSGDSAAAVLRKLSKQPVQISPDSTAAAS